MYQLTTEKFHLPDCAPFAITITSDGEAVTRIGFSRDGATDDSKADNLCREAAKQIKEWFDGKRRDFDLPLKPDTREDWLTTLSAVPYGKTVNYGELAVRHGSPKAPRAAGSACANNPLPLIIPCHRVLRKDGSLGNFGVFKEIPTDHAQNLAVKKALIEFEARNC